MKKKVVVVLNIAGLSPALLERSDYLPNTYKIMEQGTYRKMISTFPALTCSVQASLLSGKPPADHGIVGNGYFDRVAMRPEFWRQENALVRGPRIWDILRERDTAAKVAVLFWQNSKFIDADIVISPSPLHTDSGMIEWCYSKPPGLYRSLTEDLGKFDLKTYWGPLAGKQSSEWITNAAIWVLETELPDMLLVYLPHLDYICQRYRPGSGEIDSELSFIDDLVGKFRAFREEYGLDDLVLFVISEYGLTLVEKTIFPNVILRNNGLLKVREIAGSEYIDYEHSDAFAIVDHQVAHIYCKNDMIDRTRDVLAEVENISSVMDQEEQEAYQIHHDRSGELIALADRNSWFAYYYWGDEKKKPFYADNVDIHNKPGYDPCELFLDSETQKIPIKPELVKGSHGLPSTTDDQMAVMICTDRDLDDYAPRPFHATQFLGMLYRVI